ncbi:hypothetical protein M9H77_02691 [Catharanthus roseus]|uniref:Uncharacterized protein n=1 Tax=Catharanthus roseus TaxID=4058 RepID=A0ACC0C9L7_CATRO|nr:hypothetical protein M9H77_02691 [Catharanthus roseus]
MPVAELFLSPLIEVLFEKLASAVLLHFARYEGILSLLKKWSKTLLIIRSVIHDAEDKQITHEPTKLWLEYLRDLAYDLDDIVDELTTEAFHRDLVEFEPNRSKVSQFFSACYNFSPRSIRSNAKMMAKIKDVTMRLEDINKQKNELKLREGLAGGISNRMERRDPTTSLVNESLVYGRDRDREEIVNMLLSREEFRDDVCFIPIVGMGGIGKTTLAQLVYNDVNVKNCFDLQAWVCVSEEFDVLSITKILYESVMQKNGDSKDLNLLQVDLQEKLSKSKFLLILDDVWNENYEKWDLLSRPFQVGLPGSKVIVTTRHRRVALMVSPVPAYHVRQLTNDDCLSLLAQHALGRRNFDEYPNLKAIGEGLAIKCGGLPLAAKALGGILRCKVPPDEWKEVLYSKIWDLPNQSNILPVLRLSYHHLPSHLKQLFAYCSIFPKDYEFDKYELVLLWMGEGFLHQPQGKKRMEDLGFEYFNELESRSFFQRLSGSESRFVMHDLINDLAHFVAGGTCHRLDEKVDIYEWQKISENTRHASFLRHEYEVFKKFQALYKVRGLRSFLPMPVQNAHVWPPFYLSNRILDTLLPDLRSLRVLSLSGYSVSELPSSICSLIHLRYLNLSGTSIISLPESLSNLYNLQTLSLRNCRFICKLPETMGDLVNLRHLDNTNTDHLKTMPVGIGKLTNLQTLPKIAVGNGCGLGVRELQNLVNLRGTLSIIELQNVEDVQEAKEANLKHKNIEELQLIWSNSPDGSCDEDLEQDVLDMLEPHTNLEKLKIDFFGGSKFSNWLGNPSFDKLENISLTNCSNCTSLPHLGQLPVLKHLRIGGMPKVKCIGIEFFMDSYSLEHSFPSLETLRFECMPEWEEWSSNRTNEESDMQFPRLYQLTIFKCPKLAKVLRVKLPLLRELDLQECSKVVIDSFMNLTSATYLKLESVMGLSCLPREFVQFAAILEVLEICNCDEVLSLWDNGFSLQALISLRRLVIADCSQLVSIAAEDQKLPPNLEVLELFRCANLRSLPSELSNLGSLRELMIKHLPKLGAFPETGLPTTLRRLEIQGCSSLKSLPNGMSALERLEIKDCSSLRAWPTGNFPTTLKKFAIKNCEHLEPVSEAILLQNNRMYLEELNISDWENFINLLQHMNRFSRLVELYISNCYSLESFPEQGLPTPPTLRIFSIENCSNLKSLHLQRISSLVSLEVHSCHKLESFPSGELPSGLTKLRISDSRKLRPLQEWRLQKLKSLEEISIYGGFPKLESFEDDEHLFPSTVTKFSIARFPKLKSLYKGLNCLTSLQHLSVMNCPKLLVLPRDDLLDRLWNLEISGCPHVKQRCRRDRGEYWQKIASIPCVEIDGSYVYKQTSD